LFKKIRRKNVEKHRKDMENFLLSRRIAAMPQLNDLAERVERLLLRHEELKRTNVLLEQELQAVLAERDSLRSRLNAARARIDVLIERLPPMQGADAWAQAEAVNHAEEGV
jgi:chromosome segregation ATPase